jgi:hypothetical protein
MYYNGIKHHSLHKDKNGIGVELNMDWFLIFLIFTIFITVISVWFANKVSKQTQERNKKLGIIYNIEMDYVGGFKDVLLKQKCILKLYKDKLVISMTSKQLTISLENIIDIDGKFETEIYNDVTLSRLLLTGVLAFGLKKKTEITRKFLIIEFKEKNSIYKLIFEGDSADNFITKFNELGCNRV